MNRFDYLQASPSRTSSCDGHEKLMFADTQPTLDHLEDSVVGWQSVYVLPQFVKSTPFEHALRHKMLCKMAQFPLIRRSAITTDKIGPISSAVTTDSIRTICICICYNHRLYTLGFICYYHSFNRSGLHLLLPQTSPLTHRSLCPGT